MYMHVVDNECRSKGFEEPCNHTRAWLSTHSFSGLSLRKHQSPKPSSSVCHRCWAEGDMCVGTRQYIQQDAMCLKGGHDRY